MNRTLTRGGRGTVILMHHQWNERKFFGGGENEVTQKIRTRIFACASRRLHDHRAVGFRRRFHDGAHLLEIVDVECRYAVTVLGRVVQ